MRWLGGVHQAHRAGYGSKHNFPLKRCLAKPTLRRCCTGLSNANTDWSSVRVPESVVEWESPHIDLGVGKQVVRLFLPYQALKIRL